MPLDNARLIPAYVAVGSNLDDPRAQVERAFEGLETLRGTRSVLRSSLFASRPIGPVEQPDYVNAVAGLLTTLEPMDLLGELQALETRLGRHRPAVRWGPRRIDLDLLVHGTSQVDAPELKLPHPGIAERAFVLEPLAEIAPDLDIPGTGRVRALLRTVDRTGLRRLCA